MEVSGLTIGFEIFISILFGAGGALGVWFKLKGTVTIQEIELQNIKEERGKFEILTNKRIDDLKQLVEKNREKSDNNVVKLTEKMNAMKLEILQAIHDIKK